MKRIILSIAFVALTTISFGQGNAVDTAAQRKAQEEANKFISELVTKTSIKDFNAWLIENNVGVKDYEIFNNLYNAYIRQKYAAHIQPKEQPKK